MAGPGLLKRRLNVGWPPVSLVVDGSSKADRVQPIWGWSGAPPNYGKEEVIRTG